MVNVLQAMILTRGPQLLLTPTYYVFELYTVHHDAVLLPLTIMDAGYYFFGTDSVPAVSATASRDRRGVTHLTMTNLDPNQPRTIMAEVRGLKVTGATGRILTAPAINSYNSVERPKVVSEPARAGRDAGGRAEGHLEHRRAGGTAVGPVVEEVGGGDVAECRDPRSVQRRATG